MIFHLVFKNWLSLEFEKYNLQKIVHFNSCNLQDAFSAGLSFGNGDFSLEELDPLKKWTLLYWSSSISSHQLIPCKFSSSPQTKRWLHFFPPMVAGCSHLPRHDWESSALWSTTQRPVLLFIYKTLYEFKRKLFTHCIHSNGYIVEIFYTVSVKIFTFLKFLLPNLVYPPTYKPTAYMPSYKYCANNKIKLQIYDYINFLICIIVMYKYSVSIISHLKLQTLWYCSLNIFLCIQW